MKSRISQAQWRGRGMKRVHDIRLNLRGISPRNLEVPSQGHLSHRGMSFLDVFWVSPSNKGLLCESSSSLSIMHLP